MTVTVDVDKVQENHFNLTKTEKKKMSWETMKLLKEENNAHECCCNSRTGLTWSGMTSTVAYGG